MLADFSLQVVAVAILETIVQVDFWVYMATCLTVRPDNISRMEGILIASPVQLERTKARRVKHTATLVQRVQNLILFIPVLSS
jgi:hypothetical protein